MKRVKLSLDRLEGDKAVLLAKGWEEEIICPRFLLPAKAREGDILIFSIEVSHPETERARANVQDLVEELKKRKKSNKFC